MTNLLGSVIIGVKLIDNPTVLYAEKHSKATVSKLVPSGSNARTPTIPAPIAAREMQRIAKARLVDSDEIRRPHN